MQKVCRNCNQINPPEAMFCRQCASPLGDVPPNQTAYQNPQPQQQFNQPNMANNQPIQNFSQPKQGASSRAMAAAGLAVAGLLCCGIFTGIPAAIMGWLEISAIKEGKSSTEGMMMAQVGLWLGIIGSVINTIATFFLLILSSMGGGY